MDTSTIKGASLHNHFYPHLNIRLASIATTLTTALAACGGGGGASGTAPTTPTPTTFPLAAAMASYASDTKPVQFTVTGTATLNNQALPVTGSGSVSVALAAGTFEGATAQVKTLTTTGTVAVQSTTAPVVSTTVTFYDSSYRTLGGSSASAYCVNSAPGNFPASAMVGDSGTWYSGTCYTNSSKTVKAATGTASYSLEPSTDSSAVLRITLKETASTGAVTTQEFTYSLTTAGVISPRETPYLFTISDIAFNLIYKFS